MLIVYLQQQALKYLNLFCTKNSDGDYCVRLSNNIDNGILQLPYDDITVSIYFIVGNFFNWLNSQKTFSKHDFEKIDRYC